MYLKKHTHTHTHTHTGPAGLARLKQHPWFAPIDWDALMQIRSVLILLVF